MKSGTGDDPFGDDQPEESGDQETPEKSREDQPDDHPSSIPYKFRRDTVKEGRGQIQFFLRDTVLEREDAFVDALEEELGEDVYVTDAREAAVLFAMENPEGVAEVMREWGYDYE